MSRTWIRHVSVLGAAAGLFASAIVGCTSNTSASVMAARSPDRPQPGSLAYDRDLWHELLAANSKIRRRVKCSEHEGVGTIEALTESDDPAIAAKIIEHARAMQARMKSGARVRVWDPVFAQLFQKHRAVTLDVTPTDKGVRIVESSPDPDAAALLRSHALGVSAFVRAGFDVAPEETKMYNPGDPLPPEDLAIGGVPHRFLLSPPDARQLAQLKSEGVAMMIDFRAPTGQAAADAQALGIEYHSLPCSGTADLTDGLLDSTRALLKVADAQGTVVALCADTGARIGPGWAAYRAIDAGIPIEQALGEARAMGSSSPPYEEVVRNHIRVRTADAAPRRE